MSELVTKSASAIAVTDELTVLIDWVNIEQLEGFTIIIDNLGGGSGNDITDVQIDTSVDGGVTVNEDQHAGVPAVPISSGKSSTGTFTETAAFVRARAICAEGEDSTANAYLLADSAASRICTLADVKDRLGEADTEFDSTIIRIIAALGDIFNSYTGRQLIAPAVDVTEYYTGGSQYIQLNHYPVISITSIKQALIYDFDSADALEADSDYRLVREGKNGIIYRMYSAWYSSPPDSIEVVYRSGYCSAGQAPGEGEFALPSDLREAAIEQATFIFKRRDDIGLTAVSAEGGSFSKFSAIKLLPMVTQVLDEYKKPSL